MKFLYLFLTISWASYAPPLTPDFSVRIKDAFSKGDARGISAMMHPSTELVIESERIEYNKINASRAELVLSTFFKKNPPTQFKYQYQGNSTEIKYFTASYYSNKEKYWVYIILKNKANKMGIGSIHFKQEA
jgi:hypothetical protein